MFAYIVGKCLWLPPSPKAALAFLVYFYGINPDFTIVDYESVIKQQLVASGYTEQRADNEIKWLDKCMEMYDPKLGR